MIAKVRFLAAALVLAATPVTAQQPRVPPAQDRPAVAPPTRTEIEAIQRKVQRAWVPPPGPADYRGLLVDLRVGLDAQGNVVLVQTVDRVRFLRDPVFRGAAESAEAAVWRASPLPIPAAKAEFFKQFVLRFAPPAV